MTGKACKILLAKLRENRSKQQAVMKGGANRKWSPPPKKNKQQDVPQSVKEAKQIAEDNRSRNAQIEKRAKLDKDVKSATKSENATNATIEALENTSAAFTALESVVPMITPLLAASGVGLPLAGILLLAADIAAKAKANTILTKLLEYVVDIISNCYFLEKLIGKTMLVFQETVQNTDIFNDRTATKAILGMSIKSNLTVQLKVKLELLHKLIADVAPDDLLKKDTGSLNRAIKRSYRFFIGEDSIKSIIQELTIINSLFIFYNSQFDWIIKYYERKLRNKQTKSGDNLLDKIWENIETSDEYKEYLNPPALEDVEKEVLADVEEIGVAKEMNKLTQKLITDPPLDIKNTQTQNTPSVSASSLQQKTQGGKTVKRQKHCRNRTCKSSYSFV